MSRRKGAPGPDVARIKIMEKRNLMIVEDDVVFAERMSRALHVRGFSVQTALSVADAKSTIRTSPIDFAVIDLRLGDGSGLDVLSDLHELQPSARAITLSGYGNIPCAVIAVRSGAWDCLVKPVDPDEIANILLAPPGVPLPRTHVLEPGEVRWLHIERVFEDCGGNVSEAARRLNMHRRTMQRILSRRLVGRETHWRRSVS